MPELFVENVYLIVGTSALLLLVLIGFAVLLFKNSRYKTLAEVLRLQFEDVNAKKQLLDEENYRLTNENTRLKSDYANHQRFWEEKMQYIEQIKNDQTAKFKEISGEIIRLQSQQMNENQKQTLSMILNPFKEQLETFKNEVNKANNENLKNKTSFDEQFKNLLSLNQALSQDAQNLTNALRGSKKMQGDWGEVELNRILEIAGLQKNIDFYTQENFKNEDNQNLRPDVVVRLPNNRCVVVDSKVSMNDYIDYVNAENEEQKNMFLQKHIQCIKNHIDELSAKEYQKLMKEDSLDYVVIFVPIESAFVEAIKHDDKLYDYAYKKHVALTTPSSLLPILRTVENLWQIESQNKYVQKIAESGGLLYDKLANFVDDMQKIDKALASAKQSYDNAFSKLANGRGNALSIAQRLVAYGAKANKTIGVEFEAEDTEILKLQETTTDEKAS